MTPSPHPVQPGNAALPTSNSPAVKAAGGFPVSDDMRPVDEIRALKSVAECHEWRKRNGNMDSMTYLALITRIDALRKLEAGE